MKRTRKLRGGSSNNNNYNNYYNNNNNTNTNKYKYLPSGVLEAMVQGNTQFLFDAIQSGLLDPNGHYVYDARFPTRIRTYKGTPLGFLASLPLYYYPFDVSSLSLTRYEALYDFLISQGAKNIGSFFKDTSRWRPQFHSTLALAIVIDITVAPADSIIQKILEEIRNNIPWKKEYTQILVKDIYNALGEQLELDNHTKTIVQEKFLPLFHKMEMKPVFRNLKQVANTRRRKQNLLEEMKYLPPIPEVKFPGGNEYRKAAEHWQSSIV